MPPPTFVLELFSKQAGLIRACAAGGLHACGIGYNSYSLSSCPCIGLDLLLPWAQAFVEELVNCKASETIVWFSVPGGSFARTRGKERAVAPMRSQRFTLGCPEALVCPSSAKRIRHDNALAAFMFKVIGLCDNLGVRWYACGSGSSYVWCLPGWRQSEFHDVVFAGCAFGGGRPNLHRVRGSDDKLMHLQASCPGCKTHKRWSGSNGEDERAARAELAPPKDFWNAVAKVFEKPDRKAALQGVAAAALSMAKTGIAAADENRVRVAQLASAAGWQARGRRLEQVVSEYREVITATISSEDAKSLVLRARIKKPLKAKGRIIDAESQVLEICGASSGCDSVEVKFGIPWSMPQFLQRALCLNHPFASTVCPDGSRRI